MLLLMKNLLRNRISASPSKIKVKQKIWPQTRIKFESIKIAEIFGLGSVALFRAELETNQFVMK